MTSYKWTLDAAMRLFESLQGGPNLVRIVGGTVMEDEDMVIQVELRCKRS